MSELNEPAPASRRNPLIWIVLVVVGLILFMFLSGDRGDLPGKLPAELPVEETVDELAGDAPGVDGESGLVEGQTETPGNAIGNIDRSLLVPPGMRAREYIAQLREKGKPYPLSQVFARAQKFHADGSLADAHLLYFFAARENHLPSMMIMAEMSDPVHFRAEDSLLDRADAIQAWKWYLRAAELGQPLARQRLDELGAWALNASAGGDPEARQLLLNIQ